MVPEMAARIAAISTALSKLRDRPGPVFRGTSLTADEIAFYVPGTIRTEAGFTSTSADHARSFPGNALFIIDSRHAKDVSAFSVHSESEVLFDKGTSFYVLDNFVDKRSGKHVITMTEATMSPTKPTKREIRASEKHTLGFLRKVNAVPESNKQPLTSDKFAGPIAEIVVSDPS